MQNTLLLVDDEPNILRSLTRLFNDNGYRVLTANSGKEALELLVNEKVQVIISDQRMPYMIGSQLLAEVRQLYPETVRLILSGYADFNAVQSAINEGAIFKFLTKPWNDESLLNDVSDAFKKYEEQKKAEENERELEKLMYQDKLTGLGNRLSFSQNLFSVIAKAEKNRPKFALLIIDVDRFETINDTLGVENGDKVLKEIALRLSQVELNQSNVARLGNNQFSLIYTNGFDLSDVDAFIEKVLATLKQPFMITDTKLYITVSMGVSCYPQHGEHSDALRRCANLALMHSKASGGNNVQIYEPSLNHAKEILTLETELHDAIEKKEFILYYQPLINIESGKIMGAEALLRWQHPTRGLVSPDLFLSLCEQTGLIVDIGAYVLHTACEQMKSWHAMGHTELCVAVNLSQRQFSHVGLIELLKAVLKTTSISPENLELEITESILMENTERNIKLLQSLRNLGLKLSLDDFGTGYSSLSYLKQFPFNVLKIDKSFIDDIAISKDSEVIVSAIIAMAKSLGLTVIAEGVETKEQLAILKEKKCDIMQGYLFSRPVLESEFLQLLKNN